MEESVTVQLVSNLTGLNSTEQEKCYAVKLLNPNQSTGDQLYRDTSPMMRILWLHE